MIMDLDLNIKMHACVREDDQDGFAADSSACPEVAGHQEDSIKNEQAMLVDTAKEQENDVGEENCAASKGKQQHEKDDKSFATYLFATKVGAGQHYGSAYHSEAAKRYFDENQVQLAATAPILLNSDPSRLERQNAELRAFADQMQKERDEALRKHASYEKERIDLLNEVGKVRANILDKYEPMCRQLQEQLRATRRVSFDTSSVDHESPFLFSDAGELLDRPPYHSEIYLNKEDNIAHAEQAGLTTTCEKKIEGVKDNYLVDRPVDAEQRGGPSLSAGCLEQQSILISAENVKKMNGHEVYGADAALHDAEDRRRVHHQHREDLSEVDAILERAKRSLAARWDMESRPSKPGTDKPQDCIEKVEPALASNDPSGKAGSNSNLTIGAPEESREQRQKSHRTSHSTTSKSRGNMEKSQSGVSSSNRSKGAQQAHDGHDGGTPQAGGSRLRVVQDADGKRQEEELDCIAVPAKFRNGITFRAPGAATLQRQHQTNGSASSKQAPLFSRSHHQYQDGFSETPVRTSSSNSPIRRRLEQEVSGGSAGVSGAAVSKPERRYGPRFVRERSVDRQAQAETERAEREWLRRDRRYILDQMGPRFQYVIESSPSKDRGPEAGAVEHPVGPLSATSSKESTTPTTASVIARTAAELNVLCPWPLREHAELFSFDNHRIVMGNASLPKWPISGPGTSSVVHDALISRCREHPKLPLIGTTSDDGTWRLSSLETGENVLTGEGHRSWVTDVAFHTQGDIVITTAIDRTVKLWSLQEGKCLQTLVPQGHRKAWSCDSHDFSDFFAVGCDDGVLCIYDVSTGKQRQTMRGHAAAITSVVFQNFNNVVATGSNDKSLSMWDMRSGICVRTFAGHTALLNSVAFSPENKYVISAEESGLCRLWDVRYSGEVLRIECGATPAHSATYDCSGKRVAIASQDGSVLLFDIHQKHFVQAIHPNSCEDHAGAAGHDTAGAPLTKAGQKMKQVVPPPLRKQVGLSKQNISTSTSSSPANDVLWSRENRSLVAVFADGTMTRWEVAA
ncbi:unnamed protein product [Amoebophrya sp. A25]|nr:unnamed protein product [Amoebophrya sp. A25]|eukprot:GSA25T00009757001.1